MLLISEMEEPEKNLGLQSPGIKKKKKNAPPPKKKPAKKLPLSESAGATKKGVNGPPSPTKLRSHSNDAASHRKSSLQGTISPGGSPVAKKRSLGEQTRLSSSAPSKRPDSSPLKNDPSLPGSNKTMVLPRSPSSSSLSGPSVAV